MGCPIVGIICLNQFIGGYPIGDEMIFEVSIYSVHISEATREHGSVLGFCPRCHAGAIKTVFVTGKIVQWPHRTQKWQFLVIVRIFYYGRLSPVPYVYKDVNVLSPDRRNTY